MKLFFLGTGSAFTVGNENYQSNMILETDSKQRLLIDCGSDARFSLYEQKLSYKDIAAVYISHLHADHIGGLEWLAFTTKFDPACCKPHLYLSPDLVDDLWKALSPGLYSLQEFPINLHSYFNVHVIKDKIFEWENILFHIYPTLHVMLSHQKMPSYGLHFQADGKHVCITTDTQYTPDLLHQTYEQADLIFQDCETSPFKSGVHAHYTELTQLNPVIKSKMWLYHYQPGPLPNAKMDGFRGFVKKGQCFNFQHASTLIEN